MKLRLLLLVPVFLAACGEKAVETPPVAPRVLSVTVAPWASVRVLPERDAPASALGKNETRLAAEVAARIVALPVDAGDRVAKGQVVARLDARDAELALARAEAALAQAQARYAQVLAQTQRARSLREKNFISAEALGLRETERVAAEADLAVARASRDTAAHGVEKCTLRAPFPAIVRSRSGQVGELAVPGTPLLVLTDVGEVQLVAQVQARDAESLRQAQQLAFLAAGSRYDIKVLRVSAAISREARTVEARFAFVGTPPPPGSEGRLVWRDERAHVPAEFIVRRGEAYGVFIADGDKARFVVLKGAQEGRPAPLDLPPESLLVRQGRHALQDGQALSVQAGKP